MQANSSGSSANNMLMYIVELSEKLLSQQLESQESSSESALAADGAAQGAAPARFVDHFEHINQFTADLEDGGDGANANCGPTSLTMALHQLGLAVAGETESTSAGRAVSLARISMSPGSARDGVDGSGQRVDAEHSSFTNFNDLANGAAAAGASSSMISASAASIQQALQGGAAVVVSGTFAGKYPLPWTGDRGPDNSSAPGNAGAHLIHVSGYDSATQLFTVHDPARLQALEVSASALERFMAGNAGAIAIRR
jgi:hypothetical protein